MQHKCGSCFPDNHPPARRALTRPVWLRPAGHAGRSAPGKNRAILTPDTWPALAAPALPWHHPYASRPSSSGQPSAISFQVAVRTTNKSRLLVAPAVRAIGSPANSAAEPAESAEKRKTWGVVRGCVKGYPPEALLSARANVGK